MFVTALVFGFLFGVGAIPADETLRVLGFGDKFEMTARLDIHSGRTTESRTVEVFFDGTAEHGHRLMAQVVHPPFLRNMRVLTLSENEAQTTWIRTSRGIRRVGDRGDNERIFDSDFLISDFSGRRIELPDVPFGKEEPYTYLAAYHNDPNGSQLRITTQPETGFVMQIEFLTADGTVDRRYSVVDTQVIDGQVLPLIARMESPIQQSFTEITILRIKTKPDFGPRVFNPAGL